MSAERGRDVVSSDGGFGGQVERPGGAVLDDPDDGIGHVISMNDGYAQGLVQRQDR